MLEDKGYTENNDKETPFKPTDLAYNSFEGHVGTCRCNASVLIIEKYCSNCGQKLDWESEE